MVDITIIYDYLIRNVLNDDNTKSVLFRANTYTQNLFPAQITAFKKCEWFSGFKLNCYDIYYLVSTNDNLDIMWIKEKRS